MSRERIYLQNVQKLTIALLLLTVSSLLSVFACWFSASLSSMPMSDPSRLLRQLFIFLGAHQTWWLPRLSNGYGDNLVVTMTTLCCLSDYSYCMVCMFIYQYTFVKLFMFVHGLFMFVHGLFMFVHGLCTTMS